MLWVGAFSVRTRFRILRITQAGSKPGQCRFQINRCLCLVRLLDHADEQLTLGFPEGDRHVYSSDQPVALLGFGAAAWMSAPRDRYIGWSHEQRKRQLHLIVNNARCLILPWIRSENLASMVLAKAARILPDQWSRELGNIRQKQAAGRRYWSATCF